MRFAIVLLLFAPLGIVMAQSSDPAPAACDNCGVVMSIERSVKEEAWTPLGVVAPSGSPTAAGGMETRSMLSFDRQGRSEVVVIGSAGGAVYSKRPNSYQRPRWDVTVKMDNGATRTVQQRYEPYLREGDRVRIMGTQLELL
ncbi:MAG TPA: hypothetical protein VMV45_08145 [Casimicrobiaceae bacterium]|nr:hypothetical protein [Casimicrobiaceae bacterium]